MDDMTPKWYQIAEVELIYRSTVKATDRPEISTAKDSYEIFLQTWNKDKLELMEQFKVMLLNRANKVLGVCELSTGGISGTVADPRLIFAIALKASAVAIILAHNHPSGNLRPSSADQALTDKLRSAGALLDVKVLDHIIITADRYFSFADEGLL